MHSLPVSPTRKRYEMRSIGSLGAGPSNGLFFAANPTH